jgi:DNA-binding CsgD family transcriptional regulator
MRKAACDQALFDSAAHGLVVLDESGALQYANQVAERILEEDDGLARGPDGLTAATPALTAALRGAIARAASGLGGGAVALARPRRGRPPLYALTAPLAAETAWLNPAPRRVLLLLRDPAERPPLQEQHLRQLFGMTPAEARLAVRLYQGDDLVAAATTLGISRHTARTHLNAVLDKTESGRQAELMRRLVILADLAGRPPPAAVSGHESNRPGAC